MVAESFKPAFQPGDYTAKWILGDQRMEGQIGLEGLRMPRVSLFGDVKGMDWTKGVDLPQDHSRDRLVGQLRTGHDVVVTEAHIPVYGPSLSHGTARFAVVGRDLAKVPGDAYPRIRFQITDLDLLFGVAPIRSVTPPPHDEPYMDRQYAVTTNPLADRRWEDEQDGLIVDCTYDVESSINAHRHTVLFSPVVELASHTSLTVDDWMDRWVRPMLDVAALATRRPQRLSWLTVSTAPVDATGEEWPPHTTGVVFGTGIEQAPYESDYPEEWRRPENRPLFTLASMPMSLPDLLRRWATLEWDGNLFLELYSLTLRQADLPPRARFLYLVQALEGLHAAEHAAEDRASQDAFRQRRKDAITALKGVELPSGTRSFIRDNWSTTKMSSLDRRLSDLIHILPVGVRDATVRQEATPSQRSSSVRAGPTWRLSSEIFATPCPTGAATIRIERCSLGWRSSRPCAEPTPFGCSASMTRPSSSG